MITLNTPCYFSGDNVASKTLTAHSANSFGELVRSLTDTPQLLPVTYEQFHKLPKEAQSRIKCTLHYLTPCTFPEKSWTGGRTNENARACNLLFIDIDDHEDAARLIHSPELLRESLPGLNLLAYKTASHTATKARMRVMVEAQNIPPARYAYAVRTIAKTLSLKHLTPESEIVSQPMFVPAMFKEQDLDFDDPCIANRLDGRAFTEAEIVEGPCLPETSKPSRPDSDTGDNGLEYLKAPDPTTTPEIVESALNAISPNIPYPKWRVIGCAIAHQFQNQPDAGFNLFDQWSRKGTSYDEAAAQTLWEGIGPNPKDRAPATIGSLFIAAKKAGWCDPRNSLNSQAKATDEGALLLKLDKRRLHLSEPPPKPVPVYSLAGQQISTAGNVTVISAQAKAGKTAVMGALLASVLGAEDGAECCGDFLGFTAAPHNGKAVIYFDTEQAPFDAWTLLQRAAIRAACKTWPENFRFYSLADVGTPERRKMIKLELERAEVQCGGIHSVFIDGVADLCLDPNDAEESFGLVEELQHLTIKHHCPVTTVLHENPSGAESGKTRGHLGSQLERKAESNLRVFKDAKGICTIYSDRCRRASIPKEQGPRFTFDVKAGMHLTYCGDIQAERIEKKRRKQEHLVDMIFHNSPQGGLHFDKVKSKLMDSDSSIKDRTARRRIEDWKALQLVYVTPAGKYQKASATLEWC